GGAAGDAGGPRREERLRRRAQKQGGRASAPQRVPAAPQGHELLREDQGNFREGDAGPGAGAQQVRIAPGREERCAAGVRGQAAPHGGAAPAPAAGARARVPAAGHGRGGALP
ncbi:unnamed protein product, partial [Phaeothamnion confervicola]